MATDPQEGKEYLLCEYNKDGDSFRSPWSNQFFPPIDPGEDDYQPAYPTADLLAMEQKSNEVFQRYAKLYYDSDFLTSVYFFDTESAQGFGSCWLIKKSKSALCFVSNFISRSDKNDSHGIDEGTWDAIHVVTATVDDKQKVKYRCISTIFLFMKASNDAQGSVNVAGNISKVKEDYL